MRRNVLATLVLVLLLVAAIGAPSGGGNGNDVSITIRKTVSGTAPSGFTVVVECEFPNNAALATDTATLGFDATGAPTTTSDSTFKSVGGAWVLSVSQPPGDSSCKATETVNGGASGTSWTCTYEVTTNNGLGPGGCGADSGSGTGPVSFTLGSSESLLTQDVSVTFTNTFVAAVEATAPLTG